MPNHLSVQEFAGLWARNCQPTTIPKEAHAAAVNRAAAVRDNPGVASVVFNSNAMPASLQRHAVLQEVVTDFARRLLPLNAFSTVFQNVPLEGTNKVQVPFYDLDSGASTSFNSTVGYVAGDTATNYREIQIGKRATGDVADDTKTYDRKFQALSFTSEELARQPFLKVVELAKLKANKLASDILTHVFSIVTAANYGAAVVTKVAALFDSDDVADLKGAAKMWPEDQRSLLLDSSYNVALLKDAGIKSAYALGSDRAIREGKLTPTLFGFNYFENPTIPDNGENLVGWINHPSAILFGMAPVPPTQEVRNAGTTYSIVVEPVTGTAFEYRTFGDSQMDSGTHVIEASYGFEKGIGNALKRIVSAS